MTKEEKSLLLQDLCARLPYKVKAQYYNPEDKRNDIDVIDDICLFGEPEIGIGQFGLPVESVKPYLRPMSSMTEEEKKEFSRLKQMSVTVVMPNGVSRIKPTYIVDLEDDGEGLNYLYDWLNKNKFDYRGLIPMGLAIEASEDMYK